MLESPGRSVGFSCKMGLSEAEYLAGEHASSPVCHADHMIWLPRRHLPVVHRMARVGAAFDYGHDFARLLMANGVPNTSFGYLFDGASAACAARFTAVCNPDAAYRPRRNSKTGLP